ncbi:hypothetical protein RB195_014645 [Necator americanus]|uniref:Uncharacterized protein n=1 Tax=Necator americanus TaxID=51031 RepID=A0ABR1E127_NECAM
MYIAKLSTTYNFQYAFSTTNTHDQSYEELLRRRKEEEQRLIEQLRYKRACVRLAPTLPTEREVQRKIKQLVRLILHIMRSNNLSNECAELFGQRPTLFAKREATLYKYKVQNLQMRAQCTREKIISTVQGMAMSYEAYGFLILAKSVPESSRTDFYDQEVDGISLEPAFVNEFTKKELEFLDELQKSIETEMHEAIKQIENENHQNIHVEM